MPFVRGYYSKWCTHRLPLKRKANMLLTILIADSTSSYIMVEYRGNSWVTFIFMKLSNAKTWFSFFFLYLSILAICMTQLPWSYFLHKISKIYNIIRNYWHRIIAFDYLRLPSIIAFVMFRFLKNSKFYTIHTLYWNSIYWR